MGGSNARVFSFSSLPSILGKPNKIRAASVYEKIILPGCKPGVCERWCGRVDCPAVVPFTRRFLLYSILWLRRSCCCRYMGNRDWNFVSFFPVAYYNFPASRTWKVKCGPATWVCWRGVGCSERLASALPWLPHSVITSSALATLTGAVVGSSVDSLLGATVQVQYECSACATTTERLHHCGCKTKRASGLGWISNDIVNAVCTLLGCVVSAIIFLAID